MSAHASEQGPTPFDIYAPVAQGIPYRVTDSFQACEVHDGVHAGLLGALLGLEMDFKRGIDISGVSDITSDENQLDSSTVGSPGMMRCFWATTEFANLCHTVNRLHATVLKAVDNNNLMSGFDQYEAGVAADKTCASRDQDSGHWMPKNFLFFQ
jgi:hypothetical protein